MAATAKIAVAGPVRLALSNYAPAGERNVGFIDAVTTTDGGLGVLTSGEAEAQPRLRLTRYDARGIRNWSRTISIPSSVVETGENLRQASLLATHDGNLLVLSQRSSTADARLVTADIVCRVFDAKGVVIGNRGLAPIPAKQDGVQVNFQTAQAVLGQDGFIWMTATGNATETNAGVYAFFCFDPRLNLEAFSIDYGRIEKDYELYRRSLGIAPSAKSGITITAQETYREYLAGKVVITENAYVFSGYKFETEIIYDGLDGHSKTFEVEGSSPGPLYFYKGFDAATSGDLSLLTMTSVAPKELEPSRSTLAVHDVNARIYPNLLEWREYTPTNSHHVEPLPDGGFLFATPLRDSDVLLEWTKRIPAELDEFGRAIEPVAELRLPASPKTPWLLRSLQTSEGGTGYLAAGFSVDGKESLGISMAKIRSPKGAEEGAIVWQLAHTPKSPFVAKKLLPTLGDKVFAVGVNADGIIGMQLFQEPEFFCGVNVPIQQVLGGTETVFRLILNKPAPDGGYTVRLSFDSKRFRGIPAEVTIPAGETGYEGAFEVLPSAKVGLTTITARGDQKIDKVTAVHTATLEVMTK